MRGATTRASSVLARRGGDIAIFDTGLAHHAASLVAALAAEGVTPDQVTLVFNTHAHADHSHNNILFSRARIFCSARDVAWTRALHRVLATSSNLALHDIAAFYPEVLQASYTPKLVAKMLAIEKLLWDQSRLGCENQFVWLEDATLPPGIGVLDTPGHVPHHVSFTIETEGRPMLVCGDALLVRPPDDPPPLMVPMWSLDTYRRSRERINAFHGIVVPGHDDPFDNRPSLDHS
jgi:glyoxylase-like metal-dependent hydrolase (beta-lactamase superfamily II)